MQLKVISFYGHICPAMRKIDLTYFQLYLNKFGENCKRKTPSANYTLKRNAMKLSTFWLNKNTCHLISASSRTGR